MDGAVYSIRNGGDDAEKNTIAQVTRDNIPPMPRDAAEIMNQPKAPDSSAHRLADIIASDPAVAVRVLRIANSFFYSMSRQSTNLSMAVVVLGD